MLTVYKQLSSNGKIRLLGSSLQIQSVFLDFFEQKPNRKHKSDNHIQFYSYFFVVIDCYYYIF